MNSLLNKLKSIWGWVLLVVGSLLVLLRMKDKYDSALSKSKNIDSLIKDAELKTELNQNNEKLIDLNKAKEKKLQEAKDMSTKDIEDFYNGKK